MQFGLMARLGRFRRLRTKLTVLYAGLFGAILALTSLAAYSAISTAAQKQVRDELVASGTVFDRIWALRTDQLSQGAALLARDFGFRAAVATADRATIVSAMENLRDRFHIDRAFIVGVDGTVTGTDPGGLAAQGPDLVAAFSAAQAPKGVRLIAGVPYQLVASPILSPDLKGWVVFAARLDDAEMTGLERLSSIPLDAAVAHRDAGAWSVGSKPAPEAARRFLDRPRAGSPLVAALDMAGGRAAALAKPLPGLTAQDRVSLLLTYPMSRALSPYRPLLATIAALGIAGLALVMVGSWALARRVTRPISELDKAVSRLRRGEDGHLDVDGEDEIGSLADSFNHMVTEIQAREERITHLALHDAETGLPNRLAFERAVEALPARNRGPAYVAVFGVNRFAHVRGAVGYRLAAQIIRETGERLAALHPLGAVGRLSTDVLAVAFHQPDDLAAEIHVGRLLADLEQPLHVGEDAVDVTLTVGLSPIGELPVAQAVEQANIGYDQARAARRQVAFFDAEAYGDPSSNLALMSGMLWAIRSGNFELFHQPKYDLRSRRVNAAEALVRWRHPTRGMIPPDLFIPMAEETGHIRSLTDWVLRQAVADQALLARAGYDIEISVNISGRLLGDRDFADLVDRILPDAPGRICFEITETAVIEHPELALEILDRFRAAGAVISIDDFGSGLSSLAYLKQIKGQELKIDRSLIEDVGESQRDALIVRSAIDLAHSLGMKVTAEGVEEAKTMQLLAAMGCDSIQGYLIARPQSLNQLLAFLEDEGGRRSYG